jgi:hypothetical protein
LPAPSATHHIILFSPGGTVTGTFDPAVLTPVNSPIFLLIGKVEKVGNTTPNTNFEDLENLWVAIHPQTGLVTAAEVGGDLNNDNLISVAESLDIVKTGLAIGGR